MHLPLLLQWKYVWIQIHHPTGTLRNGYIQWCVFVLSCRRSTDFRLGSIRTHKMFATITIIGAIQLRYLCQSHRFPANSRRKKMLFIFWLAEGMHSNYTHFVIVSDGMHSSIDIEKSFSSSSSESKSASLNDVWAAATVFCVRFTIWDCRWLAVFSVWVSGANMLSSSMQLSSICCCSSASSNCCKMARTLCSSWLKVSLRSVRSNCEDGFCDRLKTSASSTIVSSKSMLDRCVLLKLISLASIEFLRCDVSLADRMWSIKQDAFNIDWFECTLWGVHSAGYTELCRNWFRLNFLRAVCAVWLNVSRVSSPVLWLTLSRIWSSFLSNAVWWNASLSLTPTSFRAWDTSEPDCSCGTFKLNSLKLIVHWFSGVFAIGMFSHSLCRSFCCGGHVRRSKWMQYLDLRAQHSHWWRFESDSI